jgi:hypothetical protein
MLNIHTKLLDELNESEYYLLSHIASYMGRNKACWPSNETLEKNTRWTTNTLAKWKKSLVDKGYITVKPRFNGKGTQTSNYYFIETDLLGVFMGMSSLQSMVEESQSLVGGDTQLLGGYPPQRMGGEVLVNNEVLENRSITHSNTREEKKESEKKSLPTKDFPCNSQPNSLPLHQLTEDEIIAETEAIQSHSVKPQPKQVVVTPQHTEKPYNQTQPLNHTNTPKRQESPVQSKFATPVTEPEPYTLQEYLDTYNTLFKDDLAGFPVVSNSRLETLWMRLENEIKIVIKGHWPKYLLSNEIRFLKTPYNYILGQGWTAQIVNRKPATTPTQQQQPKQDLEYGNQKVAKISGMNF